MDKKQPKIESLSYEQAFQELEDVVSALEAGQPNLEDALMLFERGQALARHCASLLDTAELRVRRLSDSEPVLPVEPDAEE
ncbi:MAG: exodeoxyribonuclease VII small subunit [Bellilinea sp.]